MRSTFFFAAKLIFFKGKIAAKTDKKLHGKTKATKETISPGKTQAAIAVAVTMACGVHHSQPVVGSAWPCFHVP